MAAIRRRGGPRGGSRGRGRGRGNKRVFDNRPKQPPRLAGPSSDLSNQSGASESEQESGSEEGNDDDDEEEEEEEGREQSKARAYNALLESLAAANPSEDRRTKRRKVSHSAELELVTEDVPEDIDMAEDVLDEEQEAENDGDASDTDGDDEKRAADPFETHFANPTTESLRGAIEKVSQNQWQNNKLMAPVIGRSVHSLPVGAVPGAQKIEQMKDIPLKKRLVEPFWEQNGRLSSMQKCLAPYIFSYQDLLYAGRTVSNAETLRNMYCLHALNHIFKTRDRVIKNNARLSHHGDEDIELRDQGFTRPKVLFILPTRHACVKAVDTLTALAVPEQQENKKRFQESYHLPPDQERISDNKPEDFRELFSGNHEDLFRVGLKFTRKTLKFFSQFYNSDIILASPLGLRLAIGDEGDKKQDYGFLSSIELVIIDQADAMLMQNWDHVEFVFKYLNLIPKESHGCDFSRVRNWYLDGSARYLRQTIVLSQFITPELNAFHAHHMRNVTGRLKTHPSYEGIIGGLCLQIKQVFTRFAPLSPDQDPDARFKFFISIIMPSIIRNSSNGGLLLFIPSYFDFVRVRNHLATLDLSFGIVSEETSVRDVNRARSHFLSGRHSTLIYTSRAHHFRRYELKGVKSVVFYGLPDNPLFYKEIVEGYLLKSIGEGRVDAGVAKVRALFSKWDVMKLERIVGTKRVGVMCNDAGDTFEFV